MTEQITHEHIYDLAVFAETDTWFSAQATGLFRFNGQTWENALDSLGQDVAPVTAVAVPSNFSTDQTVIASAPGILLLSDDSGQTWTARQLPAPPPVIVQLLVVFTPDNRRVLYAASFEDGVFVSTDDGVSWDAWNFGLIGFSVNALCVDVDGAVFAANDLGIFRSQNNGRAWENIALLDAPTTALALIESGFLAGTEALGLWQIKRSTDTLIERISPDVINGTVDAIIVDGRHYLVLCEGDVLLSRDGGIQWKVIASDITAVVAPTGLSSRSNLLLGTYDGDIETITIP